LKGREWSQVWAEGSVAYQPVILRAPRFTVNRLAGVGWRVDYTLSSSLLRSVEEPMVHLRLEVAAASGAPARPLAMSLSADKFQVLLAELKQAQTLMSSLG